MSKIRSIWYNKAFTLVELIVVIIILAILATIGEINHETIKNYVEHKGEEENKTEEIEL